MEQNEQKSKVWFIPEIITPAQYYDARRNSDTPLKRLMLAVLIDAIRCFQGRGKLKGRSRRQLVREAQRWLFESHDTGPFSFEAICERLALPPRLLRAGLRQWQIQQRMKLTTTRQFMRRSGF